MECRDLLQQAETILKKYKIKINQFKANKANNMIAQITKEDYYPIKEFKNQLNLCKGICKEQKYELSNRDYSQQINSDFNQNLITSIYLSSKQSYDQVLQIKDIDGFFMCNDNFCEEIYESDQTKTQSFQEQYLQAQLEQHELNDTELSLFKDVIRNKEETFQKSVLKMLLKLNENKIILNKLVKQNKKVIILQGFKRIDGLVQSEFLLLIKIKSKSQDIQALKNALLEIENQNQVRISDIIFDFNEDFCLFVLQKKNYQENYIIIKKQIRKSLKTQWENRDFLKDFQKNFKNQNKDLEKIIEQLIRKKIYLTNLLNEQSYVFIFEGFQGETKYLSVYCQIFLKFSLQELLKIKENYEKIGSKLNRQIFIDCLSLNQDCQILVLNKKNFKLLEIKKNYQMGQEGVINQLKNNFEMINIKNKISSDWFLQHQNDIFSFLLDQKCYLCNFQQQQSQYILIDGYKLQCQKFYDLTFKIYYMRESELIDKELFIIKYHENKNQINILHDYLDIQSDLKILAFSTQEYKKFETIINKDMENKDIKIFDKKKIIQSINSFLKIQIFKSHLDEILDKLNQKNYYLSKPVEDIDKSEPNQQFFGGYKIITLTEKEDLIFEILQQNDLKKLKREQKIIEMIENEYEEKISLDYIVFQENIYVNIFKYQKIYEFQDLIKELKSSKNSFLFDLAEENILLDLQLKINAKEQNNYQTLLSNWKDIFKTLKRKKYLIKKLLAFGGYGFVFEGFKQISLREYKTVALKVILGEDQEVVEQEVKIMKLFDKNCKFVQFYELININNISSVIILEKYDKSLNDQLNIFLKGKEKFPIQKLIQIIFDLLDGLIQLRLYQIVHCDIKPSNILLSSSGNYFYCDFGVSVIYNSKYQQTAKGYTKEFASPEASKFKSYVNYKSDTYSLGITFQKVIQVYKQQLNEPNQFIEQLSNLITKNMIQQEVNQRSDCLQLHQQFYDQIIKYLDQNNQFIFLKYYQNQLQNNFILQSSKILDLQEYFDKIFLKQAKAYYQEIIKDISAKTKIDIPQKIEDLQVDQKFTPKCLLAKQKCCQINERVKAISFIEKKQWRKLKIVLQTIF